MGLKLGMCISVLARRSVSRDPTLDCTIWKIHRKELLSMWWACVVFTWQVFKVLYIDFFLCNVQEVEDAVSSFGCYMHHMIWHGAWSFSCLWWGCWRGTPWGHRNKGRAWNDFINTLHSNVSVSFGSGFCWDNMSFHMCTSVLTSQNYLCGKFFILCNNVVDVHHTR